ncbi:zinc finger MYM-type 1-like [Paramuricea clavata]|nr:zinc finger MYM-type 1-like [Paramuricea clavata]
MIDVIGTAITDEIVRRLKEAEFFAVIADETPDTSHNEQFSITVRYVYQGDVEEKLLALRIVDQTTSEMLFETLCAVLKSHDIDVTRLRGQCYDGASNVSGIRTGLQARIKEISPSALFVHCYAHVLNLVIVDAMTSNTTARDFFGTLQNLYVFIQTCTKRHAVCTQQQAEIHASSGSTKSFQVRTLKSLCETRWACRANAINTFNATIGAIVGTLKIIHETETKAKIAAEAKGLLSNIDFEFVLSLKVLDKVLNLSKGVSDKLQSEDLDVVSGCDRVEDLLVAIEELRTDDKFKTFWIATVETCEELNIETPMETRQRKIPVRLDDHPETAVRLEPKDTFRVGFYFSVLDLMINSIETRYDAENRSILRGFGYLHPKRITTPDSFEHVKHAADWFADDINADALELEMKLIRSSKMIKDILAKETKERKPSLVDLYRELLQEPECFPNLLKIIKIALTLPLTSASAERSFSKLRIIKNRLRSTMRQDRLESLMLMSVESDICRGLDIEGLVERFTDAAPRRWNLY